MWVSHMSHAPSHTLLIVSTSCCHLCICTYVYTCTYGCSGYVTLPITLYKMPVPGVAMCVYVCLYKYVCMYIWMSRISHAPSHTHVIVSIRYSTHMYICIHIYMCVYTCMYIWVSRISHAPSHIHAIVRIRNSTYMYVCIYIFVCEYMCMYIWMSRISHAPSHTH